MKRPMVIAHRGASAAHPENTLEAFTGAEALGAAGSELDLRRTSDNVLVVHHDAHLSDGRLIRATAADDLPDWLPTLDEVIDTVPGQFLNIEIKNHDYEPDFDADQEIATQVVDVIRRAVSTQRIAQDGVLVSSFDHATMLAVRRADPAVATGFLFWPGPAGSDPASVDVDRIVDRAVASGFHAVHPDDRLASERLVRRGHEAGLLVNVWTVDDPTRMVELAAMGVDAVITNVPDVALAALS